MVNLRRLLNRRSRDEERDDREPDDREPDDREPDDLVSRVVRSVVVSECELLSSANVFSSKESICT